MESRCEANHEAVKGRAAEPSTEAVEGEERKRPKGSERETQKTADNEAKNGTERGREARRAVWKPL